jgi:hypothetical protein
MRKRKQKDTVTVDKTAVYYGIDCEITKIEIGDDVFVPEDRVDALNEQVECQRETMRHYENLDRIQRGRIKELGRMVNELEKQGSSGDYLRLKAKLDEQVRRSKELESEVKARETLIKHYEGTEVILRARIKELERLVGEGVDLSLQAKVDELRDIVDRRNATIYRFKDEVDDLKRQLDQEKHRVGNVKVKMLEAKVDALIRESDYLYTQRNKLRETLGRKDEIIKDLERENVILTAQSEVATQNTDSLQMKLLKMEKELAYWQGKAERPRYPRWPFEEML